MQTVLDELIEEAKLSNEEIALVLELSASGVSNKRAGRRAWTLNEAAKLAALISARVGRRIAVERAFVGAGITPEPASVEGKA